MLGLHAPPTRRAALAVLRARAAAAGIRFDASALEWSLPRRRVVVVAPCVEGSGYRACAQRVEIVFPWRTLSGRLALEALTIDGLDLRLRGREGTAAADRATGGPLGLPLPRRLTLRDAAFTWTAANGDAEVHASRLALTLDADAPGATGSSLVAAAPLSWRVGAQSGTGRLEVGNVAWDGASLRLSELVLVAAEGRLRGALDLEGLAATPRLKVALDADLDPAAIGAMGAPSQTALLRPQTPGTLAIEVRGAFPLTAPRVVLHIRGRGLGRPVDGGVDLDAEAVLDAGGLALSNARLLWRGATLDARGAWTSGAGRLEATLAGLSEDVLAGYLPEPMRTVAARSRASLDGGLDATWTSPAWAALTAQAKLSRRGTHRKGGAHEVEAGTTTLRVAGGRYRVDVAAASAAPGGLTAALSGELGRPLLASTVRGSASATVQDLGPWLAGLGLDGPARGEAAITARFDGTLRAPIVDGDLDARWSQVAGRESPGSLRAQVRVGRGTTELATTGEVAAGRLAGHATLASSGALHGRFTFDASPGSGTGPPGAELAPLHVDAGGVRAEALHAEFELGGTRSAPQVGFEVRTAQWAAGELMGEGAAWNGTVTAKDLASTRGGSAFTLRGAHHGDAVWGDLTGTAGLADGALTLELSAPTLATRATLRVELAGARGFALEGALRPQLVDLLGPNAQASGALSADVSVSGTVGPQGRPQVAQARVLLHALDGSVRGLPLSLARPAAVTYDRQALVAGDLDLRLGEARLQLEGRLGGSPVDGLRLTAAGALADVARVLAAAGAVEPSHASVGGTWSLRLAATGTLAEPDLAGDLQVDDARLALGQREPVQGSLRAQLADSALELVEARASHAGAVVVAQGAAPLAFFARWLPGALARERPGRDPTAVLSATATGFDAARLIGRDLPGIAGQLAAEATLFASEPTLAALHGELLVETSGLGLAGLGLVADGPARIALSPTGLDLLPWHFSGERSDFTLRGRVAIDTADPLAGALDARLDGKVPLDLLSPLLPQARPGGVIDVALRARGPLRRPELEGRGVVADGVLLLRDPRVLVDAIAGEVVFERGRLAVHGFTGRINGGPATLHGALALEGWKAGAGRFEASARGFSFEFPQDFRAEADADVALDVAGPRLTLGGEVRVLRGGYRRNLLITTAAFEADALANLKGLLEPAHGVFDQMRLDLRVLSAQDLVVDTNYGRAGIALDLRSVGTWSRPGLLGRIQVAPGAEVYFGGATYTLERAAIEYRNGDAIEPTVDAAAVTYRGGYTINVQVTGTWGRFRTVLSADPPLSEREISALLLTGDKDAAEASLADAQLALGYLSSDLLGAAGRSLGLEAVRLERGGGSAEVEFDPTAVAADQNPTTRLTAAVRLSPRLRLVYSQNLAAGAITWILGFEPAPGVEARAVRADDGGIALELRHGPGFGSRGAPRSGPPPARVSAVRIEGDAVVPEARLRRQLRLDPGDRFDLAEWAADQKRLERELVALDRLASRVSARRTEEAGGVGLVYEVHGGPRTLIRIEGVAPDRALRAAARSAWQSMPLAAFLQQEAEARVRRVMLRRGYLRARVEAAVEATGALEQQLVIRIEPGLRSRHRDVQLLGRQRLAPGRLRQVLKPLLADGSAWDDPAVVAAALRREYWRAGAFAARFEVGAPRFEGDRATLPVTIDEGPVFALGEIRVGGADGFGAEQAVAAMQLETGVLPRAELLEAAFARLERAYHQAGYTAVNLRPSVRLDRTAEAATLQLTVDVREGPRQQIARLDVVGRVQTSPALVASALRLQPGQALDSDALSAAARRLYATGAFRGVSVAPAAGSQDQAGPVPVDVRLEEWPTWRLRYGLQLALPEDAPGDSSGARDGFRLGAVADLTRRHLFGSGASAGVAGRARTDSQAVRSWLSAPRLFGRRLRTSGFLSWKEEPLAAEGGLDPYRYRATELSFEQRLRPRRGLELAAGYENEWFRYRPTGTASDSAQGRFARIALTASFDRRNDLVEPVRGTFSSANYEWGGAALGSRIRFTIGDLASFEVPLDLARALVQQYAWLSLPGGLVSASAARFEWGTGNALGRSATASLALGGPNTVRGHEPLGFDLLDLVGQAGGHSRLLVLNQELRFPLFGIARGGVFVDHARLVTSDDEGARDRLTRTGLGLGLRLRTSVGLLRLDWGYPLDRGAPGRRGGIFHLAIGHVF